MVDSAISSSATCSATTADAACTRDGAEIRLMLVSRSPSWARAVSGATRALDGASFHTCLARDALARLAGTRARYSHLLVDENDADGLLNELADLAVEVAAPDTDMLVLGAADTSRPNVRVITAATARSVRKALMTTTPPRDRAAIDLTELRAALQHARIETRYQPIIRMEDRCPIGLEALARLNHPQQGTLLPDRFVPQIEDAGLAADLTRLVSARALTDMLGPYLADRSVSMSVNFPLDVLLHPAALDLLEAQRSAAGIPASRIIVELTESRPVHDFPMLRKSLDRLRGLGYGAAIDDVGPAVPRLAPLLDLPFTSLKLDKDLVQQVLDSPEIHAFLEETIRQAKARNLTVVAEGVETDAIWQTMQSLGADQAQGFLAARPLPIAAVPIWWDAWIAPSAIGRPA